MLYEWRSRLFKRPLSEVSSTQDDDRSLVLEESDLDDSTLSEAKELFSFACSGLNFCLTENDALEHPTSCMPDDSEPDIYSESNDARPQTEDG